MKTKFYAVILFCMMIMSLSAYAQFGMGKIEEIEKVQKRKLIVLVQEPDQKMLDKIAKNPKRGTVEDYRADLATYNANMKAVVEAFWPYNKEDIQYLTVTEIEALRKQGGKDYAIVGCMTARPSKHSVGYFFDQGLKWQKNHEADLEERLEESNDGTFSVLMVNTIEDFPRLPVYYLQLFDLFPSKAAIVYGLKSTAAYFDKRIQKKSKGDKPVNPMEDLMELMAARAGSLQNKTLLLRKEWLDKSLTEESIRKVYPYKFQICDRDFLDEIVMKQDSNYAYGISIPQVVSGGSSNYVLYLQLILDAADNLAITFQMPDKPNFTAKSLKETAAIAKKSGK